VQRGSSQPGLSLVFAAWVLKVSCRIIRPSSELPIAQIPIYDLSTMDGPGHMLLLCDGSEDYVIQPSYKTKPTQDTPYRQLSLIHNGSWHVSLKGGTEWGRANAEEL
jgi:hypothetical protein